MDRESRRLTRSSRAALDWNALEKQAGIAEAIAKHLVCRRPAALSADVYASKGAGPFAHFCYQLHLPVGTAEELEAWRQHGKVLNAATFGQPALSLQEIAEITGEMPDRSKYAAEDRWNSARESAIERVRQRILRFDRKVKAAMAS